MVRFANFVLFSRPNHHISPLAEKIIGDSFQSSVAARDLILLVVSFVLQQQSVDPTLRQLRNMRKIQTTYRLLQKSVDSKKIRFKQGLSEVYRGFRRVNQVFWRFSINFWSV